MSILVPIALFGWIPFVFLLFALLPARRAVIAGFLAAWLFLPMAGYKISALPEYNKMSATCIGVLAAAAFFDPQRFVSLRLHWWDVAIFAWCMVPLPSSLLNDLGLYDGVSSSFRQTVEYGLPYLIGRLYFSDLEGVRELAIGIFLGGLAYVPFCLYEIRMSPQLHNIVYGFHQHSFGQTLRFGGWRPTVFMQHGLAVGMWMTSASLLGVWLWAAGGLRRIGRVRVEWLLAVLLGTTILCKSAGALALLVGGLAVLFAWRRLRSRLLLVALGVTPLLYMAVRATDLWTGAQLVSLAEYVSQERAASLQTRLTNEDLLADKAMQRPIFGWGGWGRNRVYSQDDGRDVSITDGMWIIVLGVHGLVGLAAFAWLFATPLLRVAYTAGSPPRQDDRLAAAVSLGVLVALYLIDSLFNAMPSPVFTLASGGLLGLTLERRRLATWYGTAADRLTAGRTSAALVKPGIDMRGGIAAPRTHGPWVVGERNPGGAGRFCSRGWTNR